MQRLGQNFTFSDFSASKPKPPATETRAHQQSVITIDILFGTSNYTLINPKTQTNTKIK